MRFVPAAGKLAPWFGHGIVSLERRQLNWDKGVKANHWSTSLGPVVFMYINTNRNVCKSRNYIIYSYVIYIHSYLYFHVCNIVLIKSKWFMLLARHRAVLKFPDANWVLMPLVQVVCEHEGLTWKLIHQKGLLRQDWLSLQGLHSIWVLWCPWHHYNHCIVRCPSSWDYWY